MSCWKPATPWCSGIPGRGKRQANKPAEGNAIPMVAYPRRIHLSCTTPSRPDGISPPPALPLRLSGMAVFSTHENKRPRLSPLNAERTLGGRAVRWPGPTAGCCDGGAALGRLDRCASVDEAPRHMGIIEWAPSTAAARLGSGGAARPERGTRVQLRRSRAPPLRRVLHKPLKVRHIDPLSRGNACPNRWCAANVTSPGEPRNEIGTAGWSRRQVPRCLML